ncbi:unnamed protein product, partial [Rotaria magnacalcarata]
MFTFDDRHLAAAILYPMYRRLTDILGLNQQQAINDEPVKKKHKSIKDQFADPDDDITNKDAMTTPAVQSKTDELERYLRMNIEDV